MMPVVENMHSTGTDKLSTEFDRNALLTLENYDGYNNRFFLAVFRLAGFFSGSFSANAENIQLGG